MPGQGTLYMRNPPAPTHRVKYILNYARPGFDPVIGPSYTGPLKPGEVQYRPPMADYNDLSEDADAYISSGEHKERHMEKTPVPSPSQ